MTKYMDNLPHVCYLSIINKSFENSKFPSQLKTAVIIPIHKGRNNGDTTLLFKTVEKFVEKRVPFEKRTIME